MEGSFTTEVSKLARVEADRYLRSYRRMNSLLRSSRTFYRLEADASCLDEAAIQAQMYSLRALVLSLDDVQCRALLYNYYIKGYTLEKCAEIIGVSERGVYRLKNRALLDFWTLMKK